VIPAEVITIPNLLSTLRLASVPALLVLAWNGHSVPFLVVFTCALLTDFFDGFLARRLRQESPLGARLDSWGDFAVYMATPLCAWWLWPDLVARETGYVITVIASFLLPVLVGFCKFRMLTSYHTWGAKLTAVLMSVSTFLLFAGGSPWPFRCSTVILVLAQLEEIAITLVMPELRSNIPTLWHALRLAKGCPSIWRGEDMNEGMRNRCDGAMADRKNEG
jgi:CDP-diacylglycerol--glycerol-3-phosphate 3-phosphatidyltransferase